ncbi:MAG: GxxExxY protein [Ignavibacteria bacterium]|nr:GxxExxY protein [Ignavibacteria bacterium]
MISSNLKYSNITELIIKAFYKDYNKLGYGFLEKVYENSLKLELKHLGLNCNRQKPITVYYDDSVVGEYFADIIVNEVEIVELKAAESLCGEHEIQLENYLKATEIEVGLLLNFGKKPEVRRCVLTDEYKNHSKS